MDELQKKFRQINNQALCYQVSLKAKPKAQAAKQQLKSRLEKKKATLMGLNKRKEKINILKQHREKIIIIAEAQILP
jgi:hypothetical protein